MQSSTRSMTSGSLTAKVDRAQPSRKHRRKRPDSQPDSNSSSSSGVRNSRRPRRNACRRHQGFSRRRGNSSVRPRMSGKPRAKQFRACAFDFCSCGNERNRLPTSELGLSLNNLQDFLTIKRSAGQTLEIGVARQRLFQQAVVASLGDFNRTENPQMLRHVLRVEQAVTPMFKARDEMDQCDFGSIAAAVKHALAKKGATERDAIETAHERLTVVDFHGMAMSALEQRAVNAANARIDPGASAIGFRLGAPFDHRIEIAIDMDGP